MTARAALTLKQNDRVRVKRTRSILVVERVERVRAVVVVYGSTDAGGSFYVNPFSPRELERIH